MSSTVVKPFFCPVNVALSVIGGKWKPMILWQMTQGKKRFGDFQAAMPGVAHKVLTQQLRQLQHDGIIERIERKKPAPAVEYRLTPLGRTLRSSLNGLAEWGKTYHGALGVGLV
jgi:DNA-binding HxlR family transcriptional regulator